MARRDTIRRQDCDGSTRPHEIELNYFRCRAVDGTGRELVFESDSGFAARARARILFGVEQVEVEMIKGDPGVLFTDDQGNPVVTHPATVQELARSQEILAAHPPTHLPSTITTLPAPPPSSPEVMQAMSDVIEKMADGASENALVVGPLADAALSPDPPAALKRLQQRAKGQ